VRLEPGAVMLTTCSDADLPFEAALAKWDRPEFQSWAAGLAGLLGAPRREINKAAASVNGFAQPDFTTGTSYERDGGPALGRGGDSDDAELEIARRAKALMAANPRLSMSAARGMVIRAAPALFTKLAGR